MFYFAQTQLESSHSLIMDNAFHPALSTPRFFALKTQTGATLIQIVCDAKSEVLLQRFKQRAEAGNRHPGHGDTDVYGELWQNLSRNLSPVMDLDGAVIMLRTDEFAQLDYRNVLAEVKMHMAE